MILTNFISLLHPVLIHEIYFSDNDTVEDLHPCEFIANVQTHELDNPTYQNIRRGSVAEKTAWEEAMTKELKSLVDLGSFEMVSRPR